MRTRIQALIFLTLCLPIVPTALASQQQVTDSAAVISANPVPLINQPLVPDAIKPGGAGFTLIVNGTGFVSGSVAKWNGSTRTTTFVSSSKLRASIPASDIAKPSTAFVTVTNPAPGGGTSNVVFFEVTAPTSSVPLRLTSTLTIPGQAVSAAVGDFNGDGKPDVAVANFASSSQVTVLLGNGDGTFHSAVNYHTPCCASSIALGDFNGDGKLDLAIAHSYNPTVSGISVFLGNGDGTFRGAVEYSAGINPSSVVVGDFNRDGRLDLAVANNGSNTVSVLLGNGDGTFQAALDYAVGSSPNSITEGDFNHDGKLDLSVANEDSNNISILLGNGNGNFQPAIDYDVGSTPFSVSVGDWNRDGNLDLAVANFASNNVNVLLGRGDGTFGAVATYGISSSPVSISAADLNGDGKLDLVIGQSLSSNVSLLLGKGDGSFQTARDYSAGSGPNAVAVGDFNRDGRLDFAVGDQAGTLSVLLQLPMVSLSSTSVKFSDQLVGTSSAAQTLTLTAGVLPLIISSIVVTGANATDFNQTNTCRTGIAAGAKCTMSIIFRPTAIGPRAAAVKITDNAVGSPQSVALSGTGVTSGPNVTPSHTSLSFPTQAIGTTSTAKVVTLTNYGTSTLSITDIAITGNNANDFAQNHTCGSSLAVDASCTINVTFKPRASGTRTAALNINDNASGNPQKVNLSGIGTTAKLSPTSLNFGSVFEFTTSPAQTVTLTNVGTTSLIITGIAITGTNAGYFAQTHTCGSSLAAGASCTISVTFRPTVSGTLTAVLSITDNAAGSPQSVTLTGDGRSCATLGRACYAQMPCCPGLRCVFTGMRSVCESSTAGNASTQSSCEHASKNGNGTPILNDVLLPHLGSEAAKLR